MEELYSFYKKDFHLLCDSLENSGGRVKLKSLGKSTNIAKIRNN